MSSSPATCVQCKRPYERQNAQGRPSQYCSPKCRSAAFRARQRARTSPSKIGEGESPRRYDKPLVHFAEDFTAASQKLQRLAGVAAGDSPDYEALAVLTQLAALQQELTEITSLGVRQVRTRFPGVSWERIAEVFGISAATASSRWSDDRTLRMLVARQRRRSTQRRAQSVFERRSKPPAPPATRPPSTPSAPSASGPVDPSTQLSSALSQLQRSSGRPIRDLALDTGVSASFISRVLNGQRLPTWRITEGIVVACDGDPACLRPLWEAARGLRPRVLQRSAAAELQATMNGLYLAAMRPAPTRLCGSSTRLATPEDLTSLLNDGVVPDWPIVDHFVRALRGHPDQVRPLWEQSHARAQAPTPGH